LVIFIKKVSKIQYFTILYNNNTGCITQKQPVLAVIKGYFLALKVIVIEALRKQYNNGYVL
jgi:hypothetical protein